MIIDSTHKCIRRVGEAKDRERLVLNVERKSGVREKRMNVWV